MPKSPRHKRGRRPRQRRRERALSRQNQRSGDVYRHGFTAALEFLSIQAPVGHAVVEEIFGPVLCVLPYRDVDHGISIANDTDYGLQNYVIGVDLERCRRVASQLQSGRVVIKHEPHAPFGGFKPSGMGREYGTFGLEAFLEPRSVLA